MKALLHATLRSTLSIRLFLLTVMLFTFAGTSKIDQPFTLPLTGIEQSTHRQTASPYLPDLDEFTSAVINGDETQVVGIYAADFLALPVIQQPANKPNFVSSSDNTATQFAFAKQYNTIGLLAHNYLAGERFFNLALNQLILIIYGDGSYQVFQITDIQTYQALTPNSPHSDFVNLSDTNELLTAAELFNRIYAPGNRLVLQTCIAFAGEPSWGRIFITATPLTEVAYRSHLQLAI